jgi:hypothetical protein
MKPSTNALFMALIRHENSTKEEKQAECQRICREAALRGLHSVLCPVLHDQWKQTPQRIRKAA